MSPVSWLATLDTVPVTFPVRAPVKPPVADTVPPTTMLPELRVTLAEAMVVLPVIARVPPTVVLPVTASVPSAEVAEPFKRKASTLPEKIDNWLELLVSLPKLTPPSLSSTSPPSASSVISPTTSKVKSPLDTV